MTKRLPPTTTFLFSLAGALAKKKSQNLPVYLFKKISIERIFGNVVMLINIWGCDL